MNRRARLTLHGSDASPDEAAAVIAAVEQFLRDTLPPLAPAAATPPAWLRTARLEQVGLDTGGGWDAWPASSSW